MKNLIILLAAACLMVGCGKHFVLVDDEKKAPLQPVANPAKAEPIVVPVATPSPKPPLITTPPPPVGMTAAGLALILDFEVGGEADYNRDPHPEWPEGDSGVTWGIGYDAHQNSVFNITHDWEALPSAAIPRLSATQPYSGTAAKAKAAAVRDITVPWDLSVDVFQKVDLARTDAQCKRAFPHFADWKPTARDSVRSLVFNRGSSMAGSTRTEMRAMRDDLDSDNPNYKDAAGQLIKMERIWKGTSIEKGMDNRRQAEAKLMLED